MSGEIRIYVADLAAYNNGKLHGVWINATDCFDDIQEQINAMLAESPEGFSEEYAIHDYEGFGGYSVGEFDCIESIHDIACFILDYSEEVCGELLNYCCGDLDRAKTEMDENYCGCYSSLADYAQELTEQTTQIPESLAYYIDYEKMGRELELSGDVFTIETAYDEIHVFWNH